MSRICHRILPSKLDIAILWFCCRNSDRVSNVVRYFHTVLYVDNLGPSNDCLCCFLPCGIVAPLEVLLKRATLVIYPLVWWRNINDPHHCVRVFWWHTHKPCRIYDLEEALASSNQLNRVSCEVRLECQTFWNFGGDVSNLSWRKKLSSESIPNSLASSRLPLGLQWKNFSWSRRSSLVRRYFPLSLEQSRGACSLTCLVIRGTLTRIPPIGESMQVWILEKVQHLMQNLLHDFQSVRKKEAGNFSSNARPFVVFTFTLLIFLRMCRHLQKFRWAIQWFWSEPWNNAVLHQNFILCSLFPHLTNSWKTRNCPWIQMWKYQHQTIFELQGIGHAVQLRWYFVPATHYFE